ncbi:MAG: (2Fe-2S)-binding protein [Vicinamibacterales bacterium]
MHDNESGQPDWSRREFLAGTSAALVVAATAGTLEAQSPARAAIAVDAAVPHTTIHITVNGVRQDVEVEDRWTLAELLRDRLGLTGTKIGCDRGECGACTVLIDDAPAYSCSNLAVWMDGRHVTTVEGVATAGNLSPVQQAFISHDAPQCGFCTSGQVMTATGLLKRNPHPTLAEVKTAMAGNLCRCGGYNRYAEAVVAAGGGATRTSAGGDQ